MCDPQVFTSPGEQVQTLTLLNAPIFSALKGIYIVVRRCSPQEVITKTITVPSRQVRGNNDVNPVRNAEADFFQRFS